MGGEYTVGSEDRVTVTPQTLFFNKNFLFSKTTRELSKNVFWTTGYVLGAQKKVWKPKTAKKNAQI